MQRAVLARELAGDINVLIAANPVFGLDFAAVAEIHSRIVQVRARGGAVLLISEDLDELLELADRIVVMSEGRIVFETPAATRRAACAGRAHGRRRPRPTRPSRRPTADATHTDVSHAMQMRSTPSPFAYDFDLGKTALVIIDMQRDFIEPGGFGETLGNDVSLLEAIVPATKTTLRSLARSGRPGRPHARGAQARPVGLPARQAQPRQPDACASATKGRWAASW